MTLVPISLPAPRPALIAASNGWRVYRRGRRLIGRQPVRVARLVMTAILFPVVIAVVGLAGLREPLLLEALVAGAVAGIALAVPGLRPKRFEVTAAGHFSVPNTTIGVVAADYTAFAIGILLSHRKTRGSATTPATTSESSTR